MKFSEAYGSSESDIPDNIMRKTLQCRLVPESQALNPKSEPLSLGHRLRPSTAGGAAKSPVLDLAHIICIMDSTIYVYIYIYVLNSYIA